MKGANEGAGLTGVFGDSWDGGGWDGLMISGWVAFFFFFFGCVYLSDFFSNGKERWK